jgi:MFS family permease
MLTPTTIRLTSAAADLSPITASLHALDAVNFFLAGVLAGFGPYVAVYLADQKWTQEKIGFVLSASALAGLLSQVPGGELLDAIRSKRAIVALGVLIVPISAMIIEFQSTFPLVLIGLTLQGISGGIAGRRPWRPLTEVVLSRIGLALWTELSWWNRRKSGGSFPARPS